MDRREKAYDKKVYIQTPPEIIGFIEKSIDHILKTEFGTNINSEDIEIIDPFAGEGQFTTHGVKQGILDKETAARIQHFEINPERAELCRKQVKKVASQARVECKDVFLPS